ncbi:MAG: 2OG-Fe(II) oxygenase [Arenimonas sp.]
MSEPLIDAARLESVLSDARAEPFPFLVAHGQLPLAAAAELERDFPRYEAAGFFPYDAAECGPSMVACIEALTAPGYARALGARLGVPDLERYPPLVTICRHLNRRHGTIHTDSRSKVASALLYLTPEWPHGSAGALRFLKRIDSIDDLAAAEVPPVYGTLVAFKRTDNSFHGHLPFEGERRVIQVAWLTSLEEKERKTRRGRFSRLMKKLFGKLDGRWGAGRDRDAAHPD